MLNIPKELCVRTDKQRVAQILTNMLLNAIAVTDNDIVRVSVTLDGENKNSIVYIHIKDNGCGLTTEEMAKIFDKEKLQNRKNSNTKGLSL